MSTKRPICDFVGRCRYRIGGHCCHVDWNPARCPEGLPRRADEAVPVTSRMVGFEARRCSEADALATEAGQDQSW